MRITRMLETHLLSNRNDIGVVHFKLSHVVEIVRDLDLHRVDLLVHEHLIDCFPANSQKFVVKNRFVALTFWSERSRITS